VNAWQEGTTGPANTTLRPVRGGVTGRVMFGLVLLAVGVVWTIDNLGLIEGFDADDILEWWPALIVAVGVATLLGLGSRRIVVMGGIFTLVGSILLLNTTGFAIVDGGMLISVVLIVIGGSLVFRSRQPVPLAAPGADDPSSTIDSFAMWSGNVHKSTSPAFRGGDATAVMGGVDLDLRNARIAPDHAVIEVFTWWGGIEIRVAPNTRVVNQATAFMGGIEDSSQPGDGSGGTLVIKGLVVMGGVDIKN
jgi:predicted membrane protein